MEEHKIGLYADTIILIVSNPTVLLPKILTTPTTFNNVSYERVHEMTSEILGLNSYQKNTNFYISTQENCKQCNIWYPNAPMKCP